ncbi:lipid kinase YegS [Litchfieldella rifensis]|uniref:Lipid kinase YegS n=1 Tax=Litchfieldella rifensis TaxID=762643 RepID=A0ABV7LLC1_9GAMM
MAQMSGSARLILNGKSAQLPAVREAVFTRRRLGNRLEVQVTWEQGDAARFAQQAGRDGVSRLIAGGGDGTVNEIVNGLMQLPKDQRPPLAILPLGSANDLATSLDLPLEPEPALEVAFTASPQPVDVPCLGDMHYLNMLSAGFGAEVTSSTPKTLKRLLGGGAYSLMGALKAWRYQPYPGQLRWSEGECRLPLFVLAIGNGTHAGGGQCLTPQARLDDGLLDVLVVRHFSSLGEMKQMLDELTRLPATGRFVDYFRTSRLSFSTEMEVPFTLDGELQHFMSFEVTLENAGLELLGPATCRLFTHALS